MSANSILHRDMNKKESPLTIDDIYNLWRERNKTRDLAPSIIQDYARGELLTPFEYFQIQVMKKCPSDLRSILREASR